MKRIGNFCCEFFLLTLFVMNSALPLLAASATSTNAMVAAAGRVEPVGEERVVIAEASGRLREVLVNEGDVVKRGQLLAEIENREQQALVAQAKANVALRKAEFDKVNAGARPEELQVVIAAEEEARVWLQRKQQEATRREQLFLHQQISVEHRDESVTAVHMAQAGLDRARAQREQLQRGHRDEDKRMAQAAWHIAQAELTRAEALLEKTRIRSPIDGTVLKRELREGETVTTLNPLPLVRIGDLSRLMVRAEIDELDVTRVKVGATAQISSDAYPGKIVEGKVLHISRRMGNKVNRTDNPSDKEDVRVLEALIALQDALQLPIGLRVDVKITGSR